MIKCCYEILKELKNKLGKKIENYSLVYIKLQNYNYIKKLQEKNGVQILESYENNIMSLLDEDEEIIDVERDTYLLMLNNESVDEFLKFLSLITIPVDGNYLSVKCKTGLYNIKEIDDVEEMIENVTLALGVAENSTISNVSYSDELKRQIFKKQEIMSYFTNAIYNNEFEVYYQPKIDLNTNTLCGSEALVRWIKDGQIVSPADFIPVLEKEDLICQLDFYMLEAVCKDIRNWLDNGVTPTKTSVNFSKNNLVNPNFSNDVISVLEKYDVNPEYIEIELTETTDTLDYSAMIEFVESMKSNEINVSIDDFGTGTSTLNLIKRLSANTIKIDKSFIDNIQDKKDAILVKTIIEMALNLGMDVIAEGTETKEQIDILYQLGCGKIQGYYFDKPLPKDEYLKRLENKGNCYQKQLSLLTIKSI